MTHGQRRGGRPSKGDRHRFFTYIPRKAADEIIAEAERRGCTYGDMVAWLTCTQLGHDMPEPGDTTKAAQRELPLTRSA